MSARLAFAAATIMNSEVLLTNGWFLTGDATLIIKAAVPLGDQVTGAEILALATNDMGIVRMRCTRAVRLACVRIEADRQVDQVLGE
jgi:ABC-type polysaccharide/polyol phosphate transport system ATPase subunit